MLKPAVCYKHQIEDKFKEYYYTEDFMYYTGGIESFLIHVDEESPCRVNYAVVSDNDEDHLIGYISFNLDFYSSVAYGFGIFSFDRGNPTMGKEINNVLDMLINEYKLHRIEWRMISGNPVQKHYDAICKKYNGNKYVLKDVFKDKHGNYHDDYIYEIFPNPIK